MNVRRFDLKPIVLALGVFAAGASQAAITVYTSEASFLAAVAGSLVGTDSFDDLVPAANLGSGPLARSAGSISYSVGAGSASDILYGAGTASDPWLSTKVATDTLTFSGFAPGVFAAGAYVFGSDVAGDFLRRGSVTIGVTSETESASRTQRFATEATFFGFVSDAPLTSLTVSAGQGLRASVWPTVNDLVLAAPIPEPETYALLLAGLGIVGFMAKRRRND